MFTAQKVVSLVILLLFPYGEGQTSNPGSPLTFTEEPSQILITEKNAPVEVQWRIQYIPCPSRTLQWQVLARTQNHTLYIYPTDLSPEDTPIEENTEYNVSVIDECQFLRETRSSRFLVNVTLTLVATDNVLRNVQYVYIEAMIGGETAVSVNASLVQVNSTQTTQLDTMATISLTTTRASGSAAHCLTLLLFCNILIALFDSA